MEEGGILRNKYRNPVNSVNSVTDAIPLSGEVWASLWQRRDRSSRSGTVVERTHKPDVAFSRNFIEVQIPMIREISPYGNLSRLRGWQRRFKAQCKFAIGAQCLRLSASGRRPAWNSRLKRPGGIGERVPAP
jgi:hypothetical protein